MSRRQGSVQRRVGRVLEAGLALVVLAAGVVITLPRGSGAGAAVDTSLCHATSSRLTVPSGYPLGACWDGSNLAIKNTSDFVLDLTSTGSVGTGTRTTSNADGAGELFAHQHPSPSVLPPGYQEVVPVGGGGGAVTFVGDPGNETYAKFRALESVIPGSLFTDYEASAAFVDSLSDARSSFDQCQHRANFLAMAGCAVQLEWAVGSALASLGLSAGSQLKGSLASLVTLVQTAAWASSAVTDLGTLAAAPKTVSIAALAAPPTTTTLPPATSIDLPQVAAGNYASLIGTWTEEAHAYNPQDGTGMQWASGGSDALSISASTLTFGGTSDSLAVTVQGNTLTTDTASGPTSSLLSFQNNGSYLEASLADQNAAINWGIGFYPKGTVESNSLPGSAFEINHGVTFDTLSNTIYIWTSNDSIAEVFSQTG